MNLSERLDGADEMMDDFSIGDERLEVALHDLRRVNRWLGGLATVREGVAPFLRHRKHLRVLDLGTGLGDVPADLVVWADSHGVVLETVALDANAATVGYGRRYLDAHLPERLRGRVRLEQGDAHNPPFNPDSFDVVTAALFLHHFADAEATRLLTVMRRLARHGVVVSDLHRHILAYHGVRLISRLFEVSPMFAHDGPLSVRRGFRRDELRHLAEAAGLRHACVGWRWAFRWLLTAQLA